jgi:energy-coupling factor transport system permease protein
MLHAVAQKGPYQPGQSVLHRADPRLKVLSCLLLVILTFGAVDWVQLLVVGTVLSLAIRFSAPPFASLWKLCWMLRWFLLLTLLMHVLLTPGRTLWGTTWISLDGFLTGVFVCLQVLIAVVTSAILAVTTSTESLANAFVWYVQPLHRLGFPTGEWKSLLLLTMDFLPVIHEEMLVSRDGDDHTRMKPSESERQGRWHRWQQKLNDLLLRLVDRGESLAQRIAADRDAMSHPAGLTPLYPLSLVDQAFSATMAVAIVLYWFLG